MPAGDLRHQVTLEQRNQMPNDAGGITETFAPVALVWAKVEAVRGAVYAAGVQVADGPTHRIIIRYRAMTDFDHLSDGARRWRMRDARDPDGKRRWVEINAEELTPGDQL